MDEVRWIGKVKAAKLSADDWKFSSEQENNLKSMWQMIGRYWLWGTD